MSKAGHWRPRAIVKLTEALRLMPLGEFVNAKSRREYVSNAYPFGERAHHPYKVWLGACAQVEKVLERIAADLSIANDALLDGKSDVAERVVADALRDIGAAHLRRDGVFADPATGEQSVNNSPTCR